MVKKLKLMIFAELIVILILLGYIINIKLNEKAQNLNSPDANNYLSANASKLSLVSPRISSGLLKPKSFLIVNYAPLRSKLESYIVRNNLNVSVYVENLRSGASMGINEREGYLPASLNKLPVAMLIMKKIEAGELSMDTLLGINDSYRINISSSFYQTKDKKFPVKILMEKMLKESDNTAFKVLQKNIDDDDVTILLTYLDYYTEESTDSSRAYSGDYVVTPKSIYNLFSSLYLSTVLEPEDSQYILSLLTDTAFDIKKAAKLPQNTTIAQKFGSVYTEKEKYFHSCGIIYDGDMRLFYCVMTKDLSEDKAIKITGLIVNNIYSYTIDTRKKLDIYKELDENY